MTPAVRESSSFRDPSGFVFTAEGNFYRQVNAVYGEHYRRLMDSGLYRELVDRELLLPHEETSLPPPEPSKAFKVLRPEFLPFISYPYEWCFSQLKDAALMTLEIQRTALKYGMWLKDASAYNVQFRRNRPVWIDTLSFEKCRPGEPWPAYKQFCQHFLAPLALACYRGADLLRDLAMHQDGFPLDRVSRLLPKRTFFKVAIFIHIHLHAWALTRWGDFRARKRGSKFQVAGHALTALAENLVSAVQKLKRDVRGSRWADYYARGNRYTEEGSEEKKRIVASFFDELTPANVWDFGSNTGVFSRLAAGKGITTFSVDSDEVVIEMLYRECVKSGETRIFPLVMDLAQPSPSLGWMSEERRSFVERCRPDTALALALLHHMTIGGNLPFEQVAVFFRRLCRHLIIEFVPKTDSQAQSLMGCREDVFPDYHREAFEAAFSRYFSIEKYREIPDTERLLYLMHARADE